MIPKCYINGPESILRSSIFRHFHDFWRDRAVDSIDPVKLERRRIYHSKESWKSYVENSSFDELESEISWIKGGPGLQTGGTPPRPIWRPLVTWRRVLRTIFTEAYCNLTTRSRAWATQSTKNLGKVPSRTYGGLLYESISTSPTKTYGWVVAKAICCG